MKKDRTKGEAQLYLKQMKVPMRIDVEKGTFLRIPAKTMHDFANRTDQRTGVLNFLFLVNLKEICLQL